MIDVTNYKQFMGIDSFPVFDVKYYTLDLTGDYSYGARAEYDVKTKAHTLMLPRNCGASKLLLFHELTHILDMETLASGEKNRPGVPSVTKSRYRPGSSARILTSSANTRKKWSHV